MSFFETKMLFNIIKKKKKKTTTTTITTTTTTTTKSVKNIKVREGERERERLNSLYTDVYFVYNVI